MLFTCLEIFFARIMDVSISTFRTILMVRKKSILVPILAFIEVFIWFIAARKALNTEITSIMIPICYSLGYATGTVIGRILSRKFIKNINSIEITSFKNNVKLLNMLRKKDYEYQIVPLKNNQDLIIVLVKAKYTNETLEFIKEIDKNVMIVVKDTKVVYNTYIK